MIQGNLNFINRDIKISPVIILFFGRKDILIVAVIRKSTIRRQSLKGTPSFWRHPDNSLFSSELSSPRTECGLMWTSAGSCLRLRFLEGRMETVRSPSRTRCQKGFFLSFFVLFLIVEIFKHTQCDRK